MTANDKGKSCCATGPVVISESSCCGGKVDQAPGLTQISLDSSCCAPGPSRLSSLHGAPWVNGFVPTLSGEVPQVGTSLTFRDTLGGWKARWGVNRMNYTVPPGLYAVGSPDADSPVLVTANYKMTFDRLRRELKDINAWILVLDTRGINVWCAAGKGTFGTGELVKRVSVAGLAQVVSHRTLILPQLGAPGVAAHEVKKETGFAVVYGPVRAEDIKAFLKAGMKATPEMRAVRFGFMDRLVLTPVEVVGVLKPIAIIGVALAIARIAGMDSITLAAIYPFAGAVLMGAVIAPALLPFIPGRAFSWKGWLMGLVWTIVVLILSAGLLEPYRTMNGLALFFVLPAISAFLTLNFTGASTYTSLSGVKKEMRFAVPAIVASAAGGIGLWVAGLFVYH